MSKCHASVRKTFSRVHKKRKEKEISDKNLRFCVFDETWTSLESTQKQISQNRERFRMSKLDFDFFEFLLPEVTKKYLSLVVFRNCTLKLQSLKWRLHAVFRRCAKLFACEPYVQLRKWICWEEKVFFLESLLCSEFSLSSAVYHFPKSFAYWSQHRCGAWKLIVLWPSASLCSGVVYLVILQGSRLKDWSVSFWVNHDY